MLYRIGLIIERLILSALLVTLLTYSAPRAANEVELVRAYTSAIEFDYLSWMLDAMRLKVQQGAAGIPGYLDRESSQVAVTDYLQITKRIIQTEDALNRVYADPSAADKETASAQIRAELDALYKQQTALAPIAEAVLQGQAAQVAADFGLTTLGQPIPTILFHLTSVPSALIVSRRDRIEQVANISLVADITIDQQAALEDRVDKGMNVSSLVVPVGGVGVYPTMIMRTTDLSWLVSTIAHEWTHNYLELRPLGLLYDQSDQLRTMNETTANITGNEIGAEVLRRYYPGYKSASSPDLQLASVFGPPLGPAPAAPPPFDFRAEMRTTRVTTDQLLAEGKIAQAETYIEQRRRLFVQNGYEIRKLNQAYFAFYGAYADAPGGAAGEDPVGPAVRALREQSKSLADFVNRIAWMTSFDELKQAVGQ